MTYDYTKLKKARLIKLIEERDQQVRNLTHMYGLLEDELVFMKNRSLIQRITDVQFFSYN